MKTSVIEERDMLSVLTVLEVEKRIGKVPGVESITVNYVTGSATVRYDEIRLEVANIKAIVHQRGHQSAGKKIIPTKSHIVRLLCVLPHSVRTIFRLECSLEFIILALFDFAFRDRTSRFSAPRAVSAKRPSTDPPCAAAQKLAPEGASIEIFEIDGLPGFNQDDEKNPSAKVTELKAKILGVRFGAVLSKRAMNCTPKFRQGHRFFQSRLKTSQYRLAGASVLIPVHPLVEK